MALWRSEEVLVKWLQKEAEDRQYVEEHREEMGAEMDEAFHQDIITLLKNHGVGAKSTVDIINALERLISGVENKDTFEILMETLICNITMFIIELRTRFPQINGAAFGLPLGMPRDEYQKISELPEDQRMEKVKELLGIRIMTEIDLTEEQKQEIYKLIGEKFFSFHTVGEIIPY